MEAPRIKRPNPAKMRLTRFMLPSSIKDMRHYEVFQVKRSVKCKLVGVVIISAVRIIERLEPMISSEPMRNDAGFSQKSF
jgi:hypothetical protein